MPVGNSWYLHGIMLPGSVFISELEDATPSANIERLLGYPSGQPDPRFIANHHSKFDIQFRTNAVKQILDFCGATFANQSVGNVDLYYAQGADRGVRVSPSATSHKRMRVAQSMIYWTEISAQQGQPAVISVRVLPTWDGTNAIVVPAGSLAVAGVPAAAEYFTLGPVKINSVLIPVTNWRINLGIVSQEDMADGDDALTFVGIQQRAPVLTATTLEWPWDTYTLPGTPLSGAALLAYLRKKALDGVNVANGTAQHISFAGPTGLVTVEQTTGGAVQRAETTFRADLRAPDEETPIITLNTATAIT